MKSPHSKALEGAKEIKVGTKKMKVGKGYKAESVGHVADVLRRDKKY